MEQRRQPTVDLQSFHEVELRANQVFERVIGLFTGSQKDRNPLAFEAPDTRANAGDTGSTPGIRRLLQRLIERDDSTVMAGCVEILGLSGLRDRYGDRWEAVAGQASLIVHGVLEQYLDAGDVYRQVGEAEFQICFETSDQTAADAIALQLVRVIAERVAVELLDVQPSLGVQSFVAPVPFAKANGSDDPMASLHSSLLDIRNAVDARAIRRHSIPALRNAGALFQPLWCSRESGGTKNRCMLDTFAGVAAAKHLEEIERLDDLIEAVANLDCVVFTKSVEGLHNALGNVSRATIVIPLHFQTLATQHQDFLDLAATLPLQYRRFVILDLIGVPTAATPAEIDDVVQTARGITDCIVLQLPPSDNRFNDRIRSQVWGVSISLNEMESDSTGVAHELTRFAASASEVGLFSLVYGVNTIGKAAMVVGAGFDCVGGSAVHSTVPMPRPPSRFAPLFGDPAARVDGLESKAGLRAHPRFAPLNPNAILTRPDGQKYACRLPNVSVSGAVVLCTADVAVGDYLALGSIAAQVVRMAERGFAVRFLEVQRASVLEMALQSRKVEVQLLNNLKKLNA
ncbi:MAG: uncharacterized protein JWR75_512 [Devosia sp.]|nr:uncharacterized protein [Devosia sp.]